MGEVYLAQDLKLGRRVALKLLPAEFTRQQERVHRFEREARAASALNHPNIVTIYEIGRSQSSHFIATEFIDGQTLRQHITGSQSPAGRDRSTAYSRMNIVQVLDIATQIASALAAAHAAGIVHRDIKPENIMLRGDGFVKVLDFGLAKLALPHEATTDTEAAKGSMVTTNPGVVMGTVQYMSPEQARGLDVDARTDIWSLGVVLYEMITGRSPFRGETSSHVIVSILEKEPPPLALYSEVPGDLERIVMKVLRKKKEERYQTASRLADELKSLKQEWVVEARLKRPLTPDGNDTATISAGQAAIGTVPTSEARTLPVALPHSTSSAEFETIKIKNYKTPALIVALVLLVGLGLYTLLRRPTAPTKTAAAFQNIEFIRLTNTGRVKDAVISPDGKYVVYVAQNGGKESIWLKQVTSSNNVEIVPPAEKQFYGSTFSRDSNQLYYIAKELNNSIGVLHRVPALGGVSAKLIVDVDGPISLSPDDKQIAFVRGSSGGERALMLAKADGSEERKLASRTGYDAFSFGGPAWSPDGKSIACGAGRTDQTGPYMSVVAVEVADGSVKPLTTQKWKGIGRLWWLQDGQGLILTATDYGRRSPSQLWYLSYANGEARRITRDLQDYNGVSLTSDSTALVSTQTQTISGVWNAPDNDADRAKQILSNKYDGFGYGFYSRFSWTPDGQIIYTSLLHGTPSIWAMTAEGTGNKQLTPDSSSNSFPSVTSDSRYVVFVSDRTGFTNVWRMDADGHNEKQLTNGEDDSWAWCSPDGKWVVYHSLVLGKRTLRRVSINGGDPEELTDYPSNCPVVSPDGKWISCYYRAETKAPWKLAIIPFDGGPPVKTFDVPQNVVFRSLVRWTPDGLALAYITSRNGISNIGIQPLDGGTAKQITYFKSDQIFWFDWSPDGRQLGVSRGAVTSDVVLIKDLTVRGL
jgi:serine/threonine protein kinase